MNENGVITLACKARSAKVVADRFIALAEGAGLSIFARIDHGTNAAAAGLELRPTELIIFGSSRGGSPLMQDQQIAGLDLPFKALVWQDASGVIQFSYNSPRWLAERHGLSEASQPTIEAIEAGMTRLAGAASAFEIA